MNGYMGSIDTDAGIGTILSHFDSEYVNHIIEDSLNMKFRPFADPMPNIADVLNRQFLSVLVNCPDYKEKIDDVRRETFVEIINKICSYYNLSFDYDTDSSTTEELYGIAHILYDVFISRFTDYMIDFFVSYVVANADSICAYLERNENTKRPKETGLYSGKNYIDPKFILIHANINQVIYNMAGYDISLYQLINNFLDPNSAAYINSMLTDNGDIYKTHYAIYILDQRYSAGVLTNIKLKLQSRTQEAMKINTK